MDNIFIRIAELNINLRGRIIIHCILNIIGTVVLNLAPVFLIQQGIAYVEFRTQESLMYIGIAFAAALLAILLKVWTESSADSIIESNRLKLLGETDERLAASSLDEVSEYIEKGTVNTVNNLLTYENLGFSSFSMKLFRMPGLIASILAYILMISSLNIFIGVLPLVLVPIVFYYLNVASRDLSISLKEKDDIQRRSSSLFDLTTGKEMNREIRVNNSQVIVEDEFIDLSLDYEERTVHTFRIESVASLFSAAMFIAASVVFTYSIVTDKEFLGPTYILFYSALFVGLVFLVSRLFLEYSGMIVLRDDIRSIVPFLNKDGDTRKRRRTMETEDNGIYLDRLTYPKSSTSPPIDEISLEIAPGEVVAVTGGDRNAISALMDVMSGTTEDYEGDLAIDTTSVSVIDSSSRILPFTLGEVMSRDLVYDEERLYETIKKTRIHEILDSKGIRKNLRNTYIGEGFSLEGKEFTDLEKKRILYAGAIYENRDIILIDNLKGALSEEDEVYLTSLVLANRKKDSTVVIATVSPDVMKLSDRVLVMKDGYIFEEGKYEALEKAGEEFRRVFGGGAHE